MGLKQLRKRLSPAGRPIGEDSVVAKLTEADIRTIRAAMDRARRYRAISVKAGLLRKRMTRKAKELSIKRLALKYGVSRRNIEAIDRYETWKHVF